MLARDVEKWTDLVKITKEESFDESPNVLMTAYILKYPKWQLFGEKAVSEVWLGLKKHKHLF